MSRLLLHIPAQAVGPALLQPTEVLASGPSPSVRWLAEVPPDESVEVAAETELAGLADLRAALEMVACGGASTITLCGFQDSDELLRIGRELAIEGVMVEPVIRIGGGGFDIRVRCTSLADA